MSNNPVLQTIMEMAGLKLAVNRNSCVVTEVTGLKNKDPNTGRNYIALFPGMDVTAGDLLADVKSQDEFFIVATEHEYVDGEWFQDRAYYENSVEYMACPSSCITEPPAIEKKQDDMVGDYLAYLGSLTKIRTSRLSPEYEALLAQIDKMLSGSEIRRGSLSAFRELLEENEWLASAIGTILLSWVSRNYQ